MKPPKLGGGFCKAGYGRHRLQWVINKEAIECTHSRAGSKFLSLHASKILFSSVKGSFRVSSICRLPS